tara:strand:+ start:310 stop:2067 length:1758 start_codon:yes stop_codon:yes gene_type:complete
MTVLRPRLSSFRFKRNHRDWKEPIEVNLANNGCVALTGVNAGGKTLTLKAINSFTDLLCNPSGQRLVDFLTLVESTDISEISADYTFKWPISAIGDSDSGGYSSDPIVGEDWTWRNDIVDFYRSRSKMPNLVDGWNGYWEFEIYEPTIIIETKFHKSKGFFRRVGCRIWGDVEFDGYFDIEIDEVIMEKRAKRIFITMDDLKRSGASTFNEYLKDGLYKKNMFSKDSVALNIEKYRMNQLGLKGLETELRNRIGFEPIPDYSNYFRRNEDRRFVFAPVGTKRLKVDEAYVMDSNTKAILSELNKQLRTPNRSRSFLNKELFKAYSKALKDIKAQIVPEDDEEIRLDEYEEFFEGLRLSLPVRKKFALLDEEVRDLFNLWWGLNNEERKKYVLDVVDKGPKHKEAVKYVVEVLYELAKLVHPRRVEYSKVNLGNYRSWPDWMWETDVPTVSLVPSEIEENDSFRDDRTGRLSKVVYYYNELLQRYSPDLHHWLILNLMIEFPLVESEYYSSGQLRALSILSSIATTEEGTVILLDEPELSLHIDWQRKLVHYLSLFKRPIVIATHSPDIIYEHTEKVVEVPPREEV